MHSCRFHRLTPTREDHNIDVIFDSLKLVRNPKIAVDVLLFQPGEFPGSRSTWKKGQGWLL